MKCKYCGKENESKDEDVLCAKNVGKHLGLDPDDPDYLHFKRIYRP